MAARIIVFEVLLLFCLAIPGYGEDERVSAAPNKPQRISQMTARPNPANPGATIVVEISFEKAPANLNGGTIIAANSHGQVYRGQLSRVEGTPDTFITSIRLSPMVEPGDLLFEVFILDSAGDLNQTHFLLITIS